MRILSKEFYFRNTVSVAEDLIGRIFVRRIGNNLLSGIIVETEAYCSKDDPASHAFKGKTAGNFPMFGPPGRLYVYFIYGNYYCLNITARSKKQEAGAVLIRALEPIGDLKLMYENRNTNNYYNLTSGPGKLSQAFKINKKLNNLDLTGSEEIYVLEGKKGNSILTSSRIGIRTGLDKKWRFCLAKNKFLSFKG